MGYACPVCGTPQRDGEHLANHLAFTAMFGDDDHEAWLDDHAPDWEGQGPDDLGQRVVEHASETEYEEVFEDTVARRTTNRQTQSGDTGEHDHGDSLFDDGHEHGPGRTSFDATAARQRGGGDLDDEAQQILQEAQEMTREMLDDESDGSAGDADESTGDASASGSTDAATDDASADDGEE